MAELPRRLLRRYMCTFVLILVAVTTSYFASKQGAAIRQEAEAALEQGARQAALGREIALLADAAATDAGEPPAALAAALMEFLGTQRSVTEQGGTLANALRAVRDGEGEGDGLARDSRHLERLGARMSADGPRAEEAGLALRQRADALAQDIDQAGRMVAAEASAAAGRARLVADASYAAAVAALLLEALLVFLPGHRLIGSTFRKLGAANGALSRARSEAEGASAAAAQDREEAERTRDEAWRAAAARSDFVAHMSHEIRTPMGGIMGMTELLARSDLDPAQQEWVEVIRDSAGALEVIVDGVLDLSKIEAGFLELDTAPFELRAMCENAVAIFAPRVEEKGVELVCAVAPGLPARLVGDAGRLRQILVNLIGNAVKFTSHGEIVLSVQGVAGAAGIALTFEVRDTGRGIAPDQQAAVFDAFAQSHPRMRRDFGGTGLGLAITKRLVDAMDGRVELCSEPGRGSRFRVHVILPPADAAQAGPVTGLAPGTRILLVEPNHALAAHLEEQLRFLGFDPWRAESEAAETGAEGATDLALVSWRLAGGDADAVVTRLRERRADLPVVALRPHVLDGDEEARLKAAACVAVHKPVRMAQLLGAMNTAMGVEAPVPERRAAPEAGLPPLDILVAEDNRTNRMVIEKLLVKEPVRLRFAEDGGAAVALYVEAQPDLVLMDVSMPVLDGCEAARRIREHENAAGLAPVPIIALTANALPSDRERCLGAGMDGHIAKPVRRAELVSAIRDLFETPQRRAAGDAA